MTGRRAGGELHAEATMMKRIIAVAAVAAVARRRLGRRRHVVGAPVRRGARERSRRNRLHLPDAPGLPQRSSRQLPDLRHGAEAVRAEGATGGDAAARALPHGAVQVTPERQQAIGIRLGVASRIGRHAAAADDRTRGGRTRTGRIRSSPP